ncbi:SGNH/GDSL hydrolase family protein [Leeuwenhoekiella aequorea]|uniref:Lysophospholipase L1-like esterase n=1 Tax=Leeuwenhoekiella aequorea TaxID=283736 RepID=A0A4Q0P5U2_9FLAO|nr:SGNH/GDSL hydrolase family protein [Leeuwenhoekiella aequorea]RXG22007.1 lysophospholipase L1-like esterase [Leeuwenhoekiella aequorea]
MRSYFMNYTLLRITLINIFCLFIISCNNSKATIAESKTTDTAKRYNYLALGDSYTIGERVCESCRFPNQLKTRIESSQNSILNTTVIAETGWRTDNLINALAAKNLKSDYDLVTILIGVNNQYQRIVFSEYKKDFNVLLETAIQLAGGNEKRVIVISIPDYAYTAFGQNNGNQEEISSEIDKYNAFAKEVTINNGVTYLNITDITRKGISQPKLVAADGLHPSKEAYSLFVDRLFPLAIGILNKKSLSN